MPDTLTTGISPARLAFEMKLAVVGLGQCGGRIADELLRIQMRTKGLRGFDIVTGAVAVDTDAAALSSLATIKADEQRRIFISGVGGRGSTTAGTFSAGAEAMRDEAGRVCALLAREAKHSEADAMMLVSAVAGGTGSGGAPLLARTLKERFPSVPVYALLVLPFEHEEAAPNVAENSSACLDSIANIADAVILCDNQRYVDNAAVSGPTLQALNRSMLEPLSRLLGAGEGRRGRNVIQELSTADLVAVLDGWTAIGGMCTAFSPVSLSRGDFMRRDVRHEQAVRAMSSALAAVSFNCRADDAYKALYLVSGPAKELGTNIGDTMYDCLHQAAPHAILRGGVMSEKALDVTVVLSNLGEPERLKRLREKTLQSSEKPLHAYRKSDAELLEELGIDIPDL